MYVLIINNPDEGIGLKNLLIARSESETIKNIAPTKTNQKLLVFVCPKRNNPFNTITTRTNAYTITGNLNAPNVG